MNDPTLDQIEEALSTIASKTQDWISLSQASINEASEKLSLLDQEYSRTAKELETKKNRLVKIEQDFKTNLTNQLVFPGMNRRSVPQHEIDSLLALQKTTEIDLPINLRESLFSEVEENARTILKQVSDANRDAHLGRDTASLSLFDEEIGTVGKPLAGCGLLLWIIFAIFVHSLVFLGLIIMGVGLFLWITHWLEQKSEMISITKILNYQNFEYGVKQLFTQLKSLNTVVDAAILNSANENSGSRNEILKLTLGGLHSQYENWNSVIEETKGGIAHTANSHIPNWQSSNWGNRYTGAIRLGELCLISQNLLKGPKTQSKQERQLTSIFEDYLETASEQYKKESIPAALPADGGWNLLIPSVDQAALEAVQSICLQQLVNHKPGNVRLRFIDTIALGEWAAPFLQISDTQPTIVGPKAWTTIREVEAVIAEIRTEMETFVQKRLGNKFSSIIDHNVHVQSSGKGFEEPYRVIVFFGIPQDLPKATCDSLLALMRAGTRCGVRFIMTVDPNKLPRDLPLQELYKLSKQISPGPISVQPASNNQVNLGFGSGRGNIWGYTPYPYNWFDLKLDRLPNPEIVSQMLKDLDKEIDKLSTVRVNVTSWFDEGKFQAWLSDEGVKLFLGEASDGKERYLEIGKDGTTNHHVFIVGQTGSGKGVLLRTMVMSGAWAYPPDELNFYLLDLKEGVGFKPFTTEPIPHNRVIALKGEREMGVAILRYLKAELENRGKAFRQIDAENISQYKKKTGQSMPRIILVIDEFQKMFEDQVLAAQASSLLEAFAREGRAFGIHLVLVTQDLGGLGSYIKQVQTQSGVRIALQCSQEVAEMVLNPRNTLAVKNLTRAGEAIYNDRAGDEAGNSPFQVAFLEPDSLPKISQQIAGADLRKDRPRAYVFNGDETPSIEANPRIVGLIQQPFLKVRPRGKDGIRLISGAAVDLKPASETILQRVTGRNFLVCGGSEEQALQTLTSSILGLASQHSPDNSSVGAEFVIVDFLGESSDHPDWFQNLSTSLPHTSTLYKSRDLDKALDYIDNATGDDESASDRHTIYTILYGLQRARDLRDNRSLSEDLFELLKEGPELGVHTLLWVDKLDALVTILPHDVLKSLDIRAILTGNEAEIRALIPASRSLKMGTSTHLGMFVDTEYGLVEKFRTLGLPSPNWMAKVAYALKKKIPVVG